MVTPLIGLNSSKLEPAGVITSEKNLDFCFSFLFFPVSSAGGVGGLKYVAKSSS
jgi:hypothetical protein